MSKKKKMFCPDCGIEMNYHAEKIDYNYAAAQDAKAIDFDLGGVVQEVHSCRKCGKTDMRLS